MSTWAPAVFKDQKVWAKVGDDGNLKVVGGRVEIRWSDAPGAKVYKGAISRVRRTQGEPTVAIDDAKGGGRRAASKGNPARLFSGEPDAQTAVAYTDGACKGNPGPAGAGTRVEFPDGRWVEAARSLGHATNNVGELTALEVALDLMAEAELDPQTPIVLVTDSQYAIGVLVKGWKAKKNTELIVGLRAKLQAWPTARLKWVKGHAGHVGNTRADELAVAGSLGEDWVRWSDESGNG